MQDVLRLVPVVVLQLGKNSRAQFFELQLAHKVLSNRKADNALAAGNAIVKADELMLSAKEAAASGPNGGGSYYPCEVGMPEPEPPAAADFDEAVEEAVPGSAGVPAPVPAGTPVVVEEAVPANAAEGDESRAAQWTTWAAATATERQLDMQSLSDAWRTQANACQAPPPPPVPGNLQLQTYLDAWRDACAAARCIKLLQLQLEQDPLEPGAHAAAEAARAAGATCMISILSDEDRWVRLRQALTEEKRLCDYDQQLEACGDDRRRGAPADKEPLRTVDDWQKGAPADKEPLRMVNDASIFEDSRLANAALHGGQGGGASGEQRAHASPLVCAAALIPHLARLAACVCCSRDTASRPAGPARGVRVGMQHRLAQCTKHRRLNTHGGSRPRDLCVSGRWCAAVLFRSAHGLLSGQSDKRCCVPRMHKGFAQKRATAGP